MQQDSEFDIGHLKRFSFRELQNATGNFSPKNILGQGGYGVVYKGCLPNRTVVAVKRLKDPSYTGEVQFQTEVEMIGLALHRNLLRLYGFCMTSDERLLVYPYMPNGSVADRLRGLFHCCLSLTLSLSLSLYLKILINFYIEFLVVLHNNVVGVCFGSYNYLELLKILMIIHVNQITYFLVHF